MSLYALPLLFGLALLQSALPGELTILGVRPELVTAVVLGFTLARGVLRGLPWALVGGLSLGLLSGVPLGLPVLGLGLGVLLLGLGQRDLSEHGILLPAAWCFAGTLLGDLVLLAGLALLGQGSDWSTLIFQVLPAAVLNAVLGTLAFWVFSHGRRGESELVGW